MENQAIYKKGKKVLVITPFLRLLQQPGNS